MLKSLSPIDVALIKKIGGNGSSYTLPIASSTQLGGVQPVAKTDAMTQSVGVDEAGALFTEPGSGGGASSKMQETVLASGVVASGTAKWHNEDTGLTVADLQEWKVWGFVAVSSSQSTPSGLGFGTSAKNIYLKGGKNCKAICSWFDDKREAIQIISAFIGDGYIGIDKSFFSNGMTIGSGVCQYAAAGLIPFAVDKTAKVYFYTNDELTEDRAYKIVGLVK